MQGKSDFSAENLELAAILARLGASHPKKIDLSLERIARLLTRLGDPHRALPPVVHIAGTNGKGSTAAFLRAMAEAQGLRTHAYTSPHLVRFNERIRLAGRLVEDARLIAALERCQSVNAGAPITFFEITTAAAFLLFAEDEADLLVLEVGLGGRFDATNVIERTALSVITSIDLDHMEFLGDDLTAIAGEKAGIIKPRTPVLFGRQKLEAELALLRMARRQRAPFWGLDRDWTAVLHRDGLAYADAERAELFPRPSLYGRHQADNAGLAAAAAFRLTDPVLSTPAIAAGIANARWPARLQRLQDGPLGVEADQRGAELWLDGAHNPHAAAALALALNDLNQAAPRPLHLVTGMLRSKDAAGFFETLGLLAPDLVTVPIARSAEAFAATELAGLASSLGLSARPARSVEAALADIYARADDPPRIVICGSLYLAGEVLAIEGPPD